MKVTFIFSFLLITYAVAERGTDDISNRSATFICSACQKFAGFLNKHSEPIKKVAKLPCAFLSDREKCDGSVQLLLSAIDIGGERNMCSMMKLCESTELPKLISNALDSFLNGLNGDSTSESDSPTPLHSSSDSKDLDKVAQSAAETLGGTISGLGALTSEGTQKFGQAFSNIPIAGPLVEQTAKTVGKTVEKISQGVDSFLSKLGGLFGSVGKNDESKKESRFPFGFRFKRSADTENVEEIEKLIDDIATEIDSDVTQAENILLKIVDGLKEEFTNMLEENGQDLKKIIGNKDTNISQPEEEVMDHVDMI